MLTIINKTEFNALAKQGYNRIPLVLETFADFDTPLFKLPRSTRLQALA